MNGFRKKSNLALKLLSFLLVFHTSLFASVSSTDEMVEAKSSYHSQAEEVLDSKNMEEVSLDSFGNMSMMLMMVLTSLLGTFFVKDEFGGSL